MKAESLATEMVNDQETQVGFWKLLYITRGRLWVGVASVLGFLVVWQLVAFAGLVDPMFTASPSQILARGREWFGTGEIYPHLADTATQFFFGYVGGVLLGVIMAMSTARIPWWDWLTSRFVNVLFVAPSIAFLPLLVIWLGLNIMPVIALIILGVFFPVLMTVYEGVKDTDPSLIEAAKSYGASEKDILLKVVLLATIPYIVAGMRLGISRALIGTVVAQMYIATGGLGYIIQDAGNVMDTPSVFVAVAMLALSGWSLNMMMRSLERRISPWVFARQVE